MASSKTKTVKADTETDEDEVDFMSDEFLAQCTKNDVRPGLIFKHSEKRIHDQLKRAKEHKTMSVAEIEESNREAGLQTELGSDNKGFKIMEKMGFKPGGGIGKRATDDHKSKVPVPIEIKRGRWCLGQKTVVKERKEHKEALADIDSFRTRLQTNSAAANTNWDLNKAQRICQTLDEKNGLTESPFESWYWPAKQKPKNNEDEPDEELDDEEDSDETLPEPQEQLERLVDYLRKTYFYCIWCGTAFDDENDILQSCPGLSREDH